MSTILAPVSIDDVARFSEAEAAHQADHDADIARMEGLGEHLQAAAARATVGAFRASYVEAHAAAELRRRAPRILEGYFARRGLR